MNRTRWKMMIGALGLSLGGLAAVAGVPASNGVSCAGPPTHTVARLSEPPAPPAPKPIDLPMPLTPAPDLVPVVSGGENPFDVRLSTGPGVRFTVVPSAGMLELPAPSLPPVPEPLPPAPIPSLPRIESPTPQLPTIPAPRPVEVTRLPLPVPEPLKPIDLPKPVTASLEPLPVAAPAFPPVPAEGLPKPTPKIHYVTDSGSGPTVRTMDAAAVPTPATPVESAKVAERKLKVILAMGDERPRFEVRDGDEVYLKVVCDRVEVKSPGEGGVSVSTMSATGRVTFVTPGGEGTCDQLAVLPGTGQVVVTGKVTFTYNWGKVETTVTGEKMNFRLGSNTVTPSAAQGSTGVIGVPALYTRPR